MIEMRKMSPELLKELTARAEWLGCNVLPLKGHRLEITSFDENTSKVELMGIYECDDALKISLIIGQLDLIATERRKNWESEFLRFAPAVAELDWAMESYLDGIDIVDASKDENDETRIIQSFSFDRDNFQLMTDFVTTETLNRAELQDGEEVQSENDQEKPLKETPEEKPAEKPQQKKKQDKPLGGISEAGIIQLWEDLTPEQQTKMFDIIPAEIQIIVRKMGSKNT